jgi:hypothetical protein
MPDWTEFSIAIDVEAFPDVAGVASCSVGLAAPKSKIPPASSATIVVKRIRSFFIEM